MKMIIAIVQPHRLDDIRASLSSIGVHGMTVTEVQGYGRQGGHKEIYRGAEYEVHFVPKIKIEIVVSDKIEDESIEAITTAAKTGKIGDGKIFVFETSKAIRIRTGEEGDEAL
ncbi:MAG: transcriptional regulator [Rhodospirillaceae bacterium]|nr:transcriptional regulator [Rhodospirillaceae bacterium]|tara:strand:- start:628 stop:966 length:339 start_codon:yes stop_codon:yes gene_type:complete